MPIGTLVGGIMAGNAAAQAQRKLDEIIKEPGVDVGAAYGDTLKAIDCLLYTSPSPRDCS